MKNTKFNLISYIAKCTLELASKETPMSSRAFCKGKHLGIEIAWVYSLGYVSIQSIVVSLHLSLALFHTWRATHFVSRECVIARDVEKF